MPKKTQPKYPIDLAKTPKDLDLPMPAGEAPSEPIYPSLYLEWEQPYGFPDEGTMTVKFKKRSEENRKTGDKTMQRVELDIMEITDTKGTKSDSEEKSGDVLDKEVKKVVAKKTKPVEEAEDEETY